MSDRNPDGDVEDHAAPPPGPESDRLDQPAEGTEDSRAERSTGRADPTASGGADDTARTDSDDPPERSVAEMAEIDDEVIGTPWKLDPRVRYRWMLGSTVGALVLGVLAGGGAYVLGGQVPVLERDVTVALEIGVAVVALVLLVGVVRAALLYRSWEYVIREDSLFLSRGVLTRVRTVAPYVRVQHIDTQRSPLERILGLSTLVVYTAGSRGADVTVPGLPPNRATNLQDRLKRLAIESEEEDAV